MRRNYFLNIILLLIILPNANYVTAINAISPINASRKRLRVYTLPFIVKVLTFAP